MVSPVNSSQAAIVNPFQKQVDNAQQTQNAETRRTDDSNKQEKFQAADSGRRVQEEDDRSRKDTRQERGSIVDFQV